MVSSNWRAKATRLRAMQIRLAKTRPNVFAANRIAKQLSIPHSTGRPLRTASVLYDGQNAGIGRALVNEFRGRGIKTNGFHLPENDSKNYATVASRTKKHSRAEAVVFVTGDKKGKFDRIADDVVDVFEKRNKTKHGTRLALIYGINDVASRRQLAMTAQQLTQMRRFTRKTFEAVQGAKTILVTTQNGTKLTFSLGENRRWVQDNGIITKNYWGNLPAGEVFTSPINVNGQIVIDGYLYGVGVLQKNPISATIRNGQVVISSVRCANEKARQAFVKNLTSTKNASRVGELGLGTNTALKKIHGNILIDEKFPGVHVAFGDPLGFDTKAKWESEAHHDGVLMNPTIIVDGRKIMVRGKSLL